MGEMKRKTYKTQACSEAGTYARAGRAKIAAHRGNTAPWKKEKFDEEEREGEETKSVAEVATANGEKEENRRGEEEKEAK